MGIKVIPIGQVLMLALLIMLIGIGITAIMKKAGASSKVRKQMFWSSVTVGMITSLIGVLGINGLFSSRRSYSWSLYPWRIVTIFKLAIIALVELGFMAVVAVVLIILARLVIYAFDKLLDKLPSKISKWYHNLTK